MRIKGIEEAIGKTPLLELRRDHVLAKLEFLNPSGSVKDRLALYALNHAEKNGLLKSKKIVEATSGNTGISLAMLSASRGYEFVAVTPENTTPQRHAIMRAYGARVVLTPASEGYQGAVARARAFAHRENAFFPNQFNNALNVEAHEATTGREIVEQTRATRVTAFVAGIGTAGTLIGVAKALKKSGVQARVIGVEPEESPFLTRGRAGKHGIQGIGSGFKPRIYDEKLVDEVRVVSTLDATAWAKRLAREHGLPVGISSGANAKIAFEVARELGGAVVTILPDRNERYFDTELFK